MEPELTQFEKLCSTNVSGETIRIIILLDFMK